MECKRDAKNARRIEGQNKVNNEGKNSAKTRRKRGKTKRKGWTNNSVENKGESDLKKRVDE